MALATSTSVAGGFGNPVFDAQTAFRRIMGAFAHPGSIAELDGLAEGTSRLLPPVAVILLTLVDTDTPVFIENRNDQATAAWIAFHTGAAVADDPETVSFAVLDQGSDPSHWKRFPIGSDTYPDRSATLILPVEALDGGSELILTGPGIETERRIAPQGLPRRFLAERRANAALFPRGHDLVLVAGSAIMALPRTTRIEEA